MYGPLLAIAISALLSLAFGWKPQWTGVGRVIAPLGVGVALAVALWREGLEGGQVIGRVIEWPRALDWLGEPIYRTDALSAGLGAWCLLLGGLCLLKMAAEGQAPWRLAISMLTVGTLYSLVHTDNLLAFGGEIIFLALLVWAYRAGDNEDGDAEGAPESGRPLFALAIGGVALLGAALLVGRTTGGEYNLVHMSLSALTVWPLVLLTTFAIAWLGLLPFTGWSAEARRGTHSALVQSLVLSLPVVTLLLRLQALMSAQALAGTLPSEWQAFTVALAWLGGLTALISSAGMLVWAGTTRWTALLTAHAMGLVLWGLGLDTPAGRYAALAVLLAYGTGRITYELARGPERTPQAGMAAASLSAAPLTAGFVGVWLLGAAIAEGERPMLAVALAGIAVLAACGVVLNAALTLNAKQTQKPLPTYIGWIGAAAAGALVLGGALPGLWLPFVGGMARVAGGSPGMVSDWTGLRVGDGASTPLLLMLSGAVVIIALGMVTVALTKSRPMSSGKPLPTALERLTGIRAHDEAGGPHKLRPLLENPPAAAWWLSLSWLEARIVGSGTLLGRLGARSGVLLGRLEGRFYLPLALILALLLVLAITR